MSNIRHDDFGEKIGGAKKDLWRKHGLFSNDLINMNESEANEYVKKANIWKKPDYQALIDGGIPVEIAYFIKTVRDSLEAAPVYLRTDNTPEKRLARQTEYIDTVRKIQSIVENIKSKEDVYNAFDDVLINNGYYEKNYSASDMNYIITEKGKSNTVITHNLMRALNISSETNYYAKLTYKVQKEQFGIPKDSVVPKGYSIFFNDGKHSWSENGDWKNNTYYVTKGNRIAETNFETYDEALTWLREFAKRQGKDGKKRFVPKQLEDVVHDDVDYRRGRDITGADYLKTFGFRGGEFGNWLNRNDRQTSLNFGFDALKDLAAALKISDTDISYRGELSIAFGSRGRGNAAAHYEPFCRVINLTKMHGAGSLAHEWWHGLDHFLGMKTGVNNYLSECSNRHHLFKKLIDTIKYKPQTPEQAAEAMEKHNARVKHNAESWIKAEVLPYIKNCGDENSLSEYEKIKDEFLRGEPGCIEKFNALKKKVCGHVIPKKNMR